MVADDRAICTALRANGIVVDSSRGFVSPANFTAAAQPRNIEVGLIIPSESLTRGVTNHSRQSPEHGLLTQAFGMMGNHRLDSPILARSVGAGVAEG